MVRSMSLKHNQACNAQFISIECCMYDSVTYPILRRMLGYTNDQQHYHYRHLMTLARQSCALTNI